MFAIFLYNFLMNNIVGSVLHHPAPATGVDAAHGWKWPCPLVISLIVERGIKYEKKIIYIYSWFLNTVSS